MSTGVRLLLVLSLLLALPVHAQVESLPSELSSTPAGLQALEAPDEVLYQEDFQSFEKNDNPPGWVDSAVGQPAPLANGLFKTDLDPTDGKKSTNIVFGTTQSSGQPDGSTPRIGTFSTLATHELDASSRFEYRGRFVRTTDEARIGLTFLSGYPEIDRYYLIGLWTAPEDPDDPEAPERTMQLFSFHPDDSGAELPEGPAGDLDSRFAPEKGTWYRFLIQVDALSDGTRVRARFWPDGTLEPDTFSIDAIDASAERLTAGRIGLWAAVRGGAWFDELFAKSPVDVSAPSIAFFESGEPLIDGWKFNRDIVPEIAVTDDIDPAPVFSSLLNGEPFVSGTPVALEQNHTITVHAEDSVRNAADAQVNFVIDKTPPEVDVTDGETALVSGSFLDHDAEIRVHVSDLTATSVVATLDGEPYALDYPLGDRGLPLPYLAGPPVSEEAEHVFAATVTDAVGWETVIEPMTFTVDKTPPALTIGSHQDGQILTSPRIILSGPSDDAVRLDVNGVPAVIDETAETFVVDMTLFEAANVLTATGVDRAGNVGTATLGLVVDTRAPALLLLAPANESCTADEILEIRGVATDPRLASVVVRTVEAVAPGLPPSEPIAAQVDESTGAFVAHVPDLAEARHPLTVEAIDAVGHISTVLLRVRIDRTAPSITISEGGRPFSGGVVGRGVTLAFQATDDDRSASLTATLDGEPWLSGASIESEGEHTLEVVASDCAGNEARESVTFTIDQTAPSIAELDPANGTTVGTLPSAITGRTDTDVETIELLAAHLSPLVTQPAADGSFTISGIPFAEGANRFTLRTTDRAGNASELAYSVTVRTKAPTVEILESGSPIADGAFFNRIIAPEIRSDDASATVTATLNGSPFASGTAISAEGAHALSATATDDLGHSASASVAFTIDRTPPVVTITSPIAGTVDADHVEVRGNAGDSVSVSVNATAVTPATDGSFILASLPLEPGENLIAVTGRDRAGNTGRAEVVVTRGGEGPALLTSPSDGSLTNRRTTLVAGRVITPSAVAEVRVQGPGAGGQGRVASFDPGGFFRITDFPLVEGENIITVEAVPSSPLASRLSALSVTVAADFTAPDLTILESGAPLDDGARFATEAIIDLLATDNDPSRLSSLASRLYIDGSLVTPPHTVTASGGHTVLATATDAAGNQRRVERSFFIGDREGTATGCAIAALDPADGSIINATTTRLAGRTSAPRVRINGTDVEVIDGSFCTTIPLGQEGSNPITLSCLDSSGSPIGEPVAMSLARVTGAPSITIAAPAEGAVFTSETITVSGETDAEAVEVLINGTSANLSPLASRLSFSLDSVRLTEGLNIITVRARNSAMRSSVATRRVTYRKTLPSISITSPTGAAETGAATIDISGTYAHLDPATLMIERSGAGGQGPDVRVFGDTTGSFVFHEIPLSAGTNLVTVSGRDVLGRETSANATITRIDGRPSIAIDAPADNAYFGSATRDAVTMSGTFNAAGGATVEVNGVPATIDGTSFSSSIPFSTFAGGITPMVARVTEPSGNVALDVIRVTKFAEATSVREVFPADGAVSVEPTAMILLGFSNPLDRASLSSGFSIVDGAGVPVSGILHLDREVLSFAPSAPLRDGERYTIRVTTSATDLSGTAVVPHESSLTVASSAPTSAPSIDPITASCGSEIAITGGAPAGARVSLDSGSLSLFTTANLSGLYRFELPASGRSGYQLVRVRVVGADGSLSPAAEQCLLLDCEGEQVTAASFDRATNELTILFSGAIDASTLSAGEGGTILIQHSDGRILGGTATPQSSSVVVVPAEDLSAASFTLTVTTGVRDALGRPLTAPYAQSFLVGGTEPAPGEGAGLLVGESLSSATGRPLGAAGVDVTQPVNAYETGDREDQR